MDGTELIREAIRKVVAGGSLEEEEAGKVMASIMDGEASPAQIGALLIAMRLKGETVGEITGFARVMKSRAAPVRTRHRVLVDTCGTGGDGANTFNISTAAALVAAGCGAAVAKHGNRSVSSRCGSADLLEALGVNIDLSAEEAGSCLDEVGMAFLFAPVLHGAMRHAAGPRREIGVRTVFNLLGPLTNPAGANAQVLGVFSRDLVPRLAEVLARLGVRRAFVLHGAGGTDEITPAGPAYVCEVAGGKIRSYEIDPMAYGIKRCRLDSLRGGTPAENAAIVKRILEGEGGPRRDAVILNSALALVAAGLAPDLARGLEKARAAIDTGEAAKKLRQLVEFTARPAAKAALP